MARGDFKQRVVFELVDKASKEAKQISGGFGTIKKAIGALVAGRALQSFISFLRDATKAAAEQETADRRLAIALRQLTPAAEGLLPSLKAQADELQKLGVASNETVQATQALLANFGVAPESLDLATQAAADLSAALGISLESAARNVGRTVGGFAGELGEVIPELKTLSVEALKAGEGIELLATKFAGQAAGQAQTYAKSMDRLNEALADTSKVIGEDLASPGAAQSVRNMAFAIEQANDAAAGSRLTGFFEDLATGARNIATTFISVGAGILEYNGLLGQADEAARLRVETSKALELQLAREGDELARIAELERAAVESQTAFAAAAKELGVTLETEVNAELEENNALLVEADRLYRAQIITRQDYENVTRAVIETEVELKTELTGITETVGALSTEFSTGGATLETYRSSVEQLSSSLNTLTTATSAAVQATAVLNNRNVSGAVARDSRNQADVDNNIGSTITGRVNIRGGSRLVRE